MKRASLRYLHSFTLVWVGLLGATACHSPRAVPHALSAPLVAREVQPRPRLVTLVGTVYRQRDSTTVIPGLELGFRPQGPDSTGRAWRDVTKADGGYAVTLPSGQAYRVAWNKQNEEGQHGEMPAFFLDQGLSDTTRRDFYVPYVDNCCSDTSSAGPSLYFDTHSAALRPSSLARAASFLRLLTSPGAQASFAVVVVGHAEPGDVPRHHPEPARYLRELARQRALNACRYLHAHGMARQRLYVVSRGDQLPAVPNTSPEYRQLNRRVDFQLRYLPNAPTLDPAAAYDAIVKRAAKGTTRPKSVQGKGRMVPARVPPKATK